LAALACVLALAGPARAQDLDALALSLVDEDRAAEGLPPLEPSTRLDEVARGHAEDMLERGYYDHVSPEGEDVRDRFLAAGGGRGPVVAENLARCEGCPTPPGPERVRDFQEGWMQSPGHRGNVLGRGLDRFGFGVASGDGVTLAVQVFAGPGTPPHAAPDAAPVGRGEAAAEALEAVGAARGGPPLEASDALDAAAGEAARGAALDGDGLALPDDLFALLPEGAEGWTGLAIAAEACTGCGARRVRGDAAHFAGTLAEGAMDGATHMGFALHAEGTGLKIAVAVFGTR
jgi:hypothetical protein